MVDDLMDWSDGQITVEELDKLAEAVKETRASYEAAKEEAARLYELKEMAESAFVEAMQKAGKKKYHVAGVGTANLVTTSSVNTPKTLSDKLALYQYIEQKYGNDYLMDTLSIHSKTLNSFYNKEFEDSDNKALFKIPGLEEPKAKITLRITKER